MQGRRRSIADRNRRFLVVLCCLVSWTAETEGETVKDYDLKAVFLFNFVQFVEWPTETFRDPKAPIVIGILEDDLVEKSLDQVVRNEMIRNRKLAVKRYQNVDEIDSCQILFFSRSKSGDCEKIFSDLKGKPVLTVGESEEFSSAGGMIRFLTDQNKIRLRINTEATKAAGLKMSSKLLKAAHQIVKTAPR